MAEMLNCPFCGSEPQRDAGWGGHLSCPNLQCPIGGELHDEHTLWFAEDAWNRRTPPPQAAGGEPVAWVGIDKESGARRLFDKREDAGQWMDREWFELRPLYDHPPVVGQEWP